MGAIMRASVVLVLAALSYTYAQAPGGDIGCKECEIEVKHFLHKAGSQDGVEFEQPYLYFEVCTSHEFHRFSCDRFVKHDWANIAAALYHDDQAPHVCSHMTGLPCWNNTTPGPHHPTHPHPTRHHTTTAPVKDDPYSDCDVCMTQIAKIAGIYEDAPVLAHVEKRLLYASDGYCANPVIGLDEYEQLACQDWLKLFIPPAMRALSGAYASQSQYLCSSWFNGVCEVPTL